MPLNSKKSAGIEPVDARLVHKVVRQMVSAVHPTKIMIFGSTACGKPTQDSDVDFLVIMESKKRAVDRAIEVTKSLKDHPFPMDILVRTPREISKRLRLGDPFFKEIMNRGKVLYER